MKSFFLCFNFLFCLSLWAAQDAMVVVDKAYIYADELMSSPVGYVLRGKKVRIGEKARNREQVYPIVVSGKIAYIRAVDINMAIVDGEKTNFVTERFQNSTISEKVETTFSLSFNQFQSQANLSASNGELLDKETLLWQGISLRGSGIVKGAWEFQVLANYYLGGIGEEELRMFEAGLGGGFRFINLKNFYARIETQFLTIPWASYSLADDFRVNGTGYSYGFGLSLGLKILSHLGFEIYGGGYYTELGGFDVPRPYSSIEPIFYGTRLGAGLNYAF